MKAKGRFTYLFIHNLWHFYGRNISLNVFHFHCCSALLSLLNYSKKKAFNSISHSSPLYTIHTCDEFNRCRRGAGRNMLVPSPSYVQWLPACKKDIYMHRKIYVLRHHFHDQKGKNCSIPSHGGAHAIPIQIDADSLAFAHRQEAGQDATYIWNISIEGYFFRSQREIKECNTFSSCAFPPQPSHETPHLPG